MHWHHLRSHSRVLQVFQITSHIVGFRSVLRVVNFDSCRSAKTGLLRCCLYTPSRLQQTAVSNCNSIENNKNKYVKVARLRFYPKTEHNGFLRSIISLCMHLDLSTSFELLWTPPGITPLPPTGGRTRWLMPLPILPKWHGPELLCSTFLV